MKRTTKLTREQCAVEISLLTDAAYAKYNSQAYGCGYISSTLASALELLSTKDQQRFITQIRTSTVLQPN